MQLARLLLADALPRLVGRVVGLQRAVRRRVPEPLVLDPHAAELRWVEVPGQQRPAGNQVVQHARVHTEQDVHAHRTKLQLLAEVLATKGPVIVALFLGRLQKIVPQERAAERVQFVLRRGERLVYDRER